MVRRFFSCNAASAVAVPVTRSSQHLPVARPYKKSVGGNEVSSVNAVTEIKLVCDDSTPSDTTQNTGIDDSNESRYMAKAPQRIQDKPVTRNHLPVHRTRTIDIEHDQSNDIEIKLKTTSYGKESVLPSRNEEIIHSDAESSMMQCDTNRFSGLTDSIESNSSDDNIDSKGDSSSEERKSPPPEKRITALTEAIGTKQSDISVELCAMIKRMKRMVEDMDQMQKANNSKEWRKKAPQYVADCQTLHKTAIKMTNKQVLLAHQATKYVERLEHELFNVQSSFHKLPPRPSVREAISKPPKVRSNPKKHQVRTKQKKSPVRTLYDADGDTCEEAKFCIHEIVVNATKREASVGPIIDQYNDADSGSKVSYLDSSDASNP